MTSASRAPDGISRWPAISEPNNATPITPPVYDHLAGELGVGLTDALMRQGVLRSDGGRFALTGHGERRLLALGVDVGTARSSQRAFARHCIDWTERRPHLAGALGAAVAQRLFELGWIERVPGGRAVRLSLQGADELRARFALSF